MRAWKGGNESTEEDLGKDDNEKIDGLFGHSIDFGMECIGGCWRFGKKVWL